MGRIWVLDTETKGTGAEIVPLDKVLERRASPPRRRFLDPAARPVEQPKPEPAPAPPRRFRVTDVVSGQVLADDASARDTVDVLKPLRSVADVKVYVFEPEDEEWRLLTLREQRSLWALRDR